MRTEDRLRRAERDQDSLAVLRTRLRAGTMTRPRLAVLAYVGHRDARTILKDRMSQGCMMDRACACAFLDESYDGEDFVCVEGEGGTGDFVRGLVDLLAGLEPIEGKSTIQVEHRHGDEVSVRGQEQEVSIRPEVWWSSLVETSLNQVRLRTWVCPGCQVMDMEAEDRLAIMVLDQENEIHESDPGDEGALGGDLVCTCEVVREGLVNAKAWLECPRPEEFRVWHIDQDIWRCSILTESETWAARPYWLRPLVQRAQYELGHEETRDTIRQALTRRVV